MPHWSKRLFLGGILSVGLATQLGIVSPPRLIAHAQETVSNAAPSFEVASVKLNNLDGPSRTSEYHSSDTWKLNYSNTPLIYFLQKAYGVKDYQVIGPELIKSRKYDIIATGTYNPNEPEAWQLMLQKLLVDRFQLRLRRETRSLPGLALVVYKKNPKLKEAKQIDGYDISRYYGHDDYKGASSADLARNLTRITGLPVVDETGLKGRYDFRLDYSPESQSGVPDSSAKSATDASAPSIFTALQEQLGLKLRSVKESVEVLVVDHVEKPSDN